MGLFDKHEKKLRKEFSKKNAGYCRETVKELEELYDEIKAAYADIETIITEFSEFKEEVSQRLNTEDKAKMEHFLKYFKKTDKCARDAVRDVSDLLRGQKKKLREALQDE